jgi:hypothetical protein
LNFLATGDARRFKPYSEFYCPVRNDAFAPKIGAVQNWLKTQPEENFFFDGVKEIVKR